MPKRNYISLLALILMAYALVRVAHLYPRWDKPATEATISWDVFGYYLYLPAVFIYNDLGKLSFIDEVFETYHPAGDFHHAVKQDNGNWVMKYPIGMAILYLPFFLLGHIAAHIGDFPIDGFSAPYQFAISFGSWCYAILGLWIVRKILLKYFSDWVTAFVLVIYVLGTNYLNYVSFDGAMPHNVLFTLYALILYLTIRWHEQPKWNYALGIGLAIGAATILRPTELMASLIPLIWGVWNKESLKQKISLIRSQFWHVLILGAGLMAMGMCQLIYWKLYSGQFIYYSYGEFGFHWLRPHILDGFFSFRKGWLIYTPIMIFALIGFIPFFRHHREKFWAATIYFALNVYVVFAWEVWWYGGSFGARPLVQSYAILALPLASFLTYMLERKVLSIICIAFMLLCMDLNLTMTWQAHAKEGGWDSEYMTRAYYWKIFGSTHADKADKKFLDVKHELSSTDGMQIKRLHMADFEQDTTGSLTNRHVENGGKAYLLNGENQFTPAYEISLKDLSPKEDSWIRVNAKTFYTQIQWNRWQMAQLTTQFIRDGKAYKHTGARIHWATDPWKWNDFGYEMKVPSNYQPNDVLKVYVWNAGSAMEMFIDDLKVELIEPED